MMLSNEVGRHLSGLRNIFYFDKIERFLLTNLILMLDEWLVLFMVKSVPQLYKSGRFMTKMEQDTLAIKYHPHPLNHFLRGVTLNISHIVLWGGSQKM